MRALLVAVVLAGLGCRQIEHSPRPSWAAEEPGLAGTVNLSERCVSNFDSSVDYFPRKTRFLHSAQIEVSYHGYYKVVSFTPAVDNKEALQYALVQCGTSSPPGFPPARVIEVPIRRFTTANHSILSAVTLLGVENRLAGVTNCHNITEPTIRELALEQEIPEVGGGTPSNIELAMAVNPDVHFTFYSAYPEFNLHPKLWEVGVTAFPMADHMESAPLGRAEWVKLLALLVNKEAHANEWFAERRKARGIGVDRASAECNSRIHPHSRRQSEPRSVRVSGTGSLRTCGVHLRPACAGIRQTTLSSHGVRQVLGTMLCLR